MELQFDGWTVNTVSGDVTRDGSTVRLQQQPLRILVELYRHAGSVVTREQLVKVLWPEGFVDFDNGLNVAVRKLRVALNDVGETPKYIETLPRVGYRFIGAPSAAAPAPAPKTISRKQTVLLWVAVVSIALIIATFRWWPIPGAREPSVRAQELYLEGLQQRARRDISILDARALAHEKFEAALQEDSEYPQAWAALASSFSVAVHTQAMTPAEGLPKARASATAAIHIDDQAPEGHIAYGEILMKHDRDYALAKREIDRALELDDRSSRAWQLLAIWHADMGHIDEALAAMRRAREIEPTSLQWSTIHARLLFSARRYDEAIAYLKPLADANPKLDPAHSILAWSMIATGNLVGAEEQIRLVTVPAVNPSDAGYLFAKLGRRDEALAEIARLDARGREGFGVGYDQAIIYSALGESDKACEALARAVDDHSTLLGWMRLDPRLDPVRGRQCFSEVEKRVYPPT